MEKPDEEQKRNVAAILLNPVVLIPLIIIFGIFALIGAAMFGIDSGVLRSMGKLEFARGLITYLFAVVTIGTAVVLVVFTLSSGSSEEIEKKFQRGKEILSLLLGVFGTIVGFYFGSVSRDSTGVEASSLKLTPLLLSQARVAKGQQLSVTAAASGGTPPYRYNLEIAGSVLPEEQKVREGGWIVYNMAVPETSPLGNQEVVIRLTDSAGRIATSTAPIQVLPAGKP